jgi:hypothetical protein
MCAAHARRRLPDTQLVKYVGFPSVFQGVVKIDEIVDAKGSSKKALRVHVRISHECLKADAGGDIKSGEKVWG